MASEWQGTRAGQCAHATFVVKEDDGMPYLDFNPGDMHPIVAARCLQACLDMLVAAEAAAAARLFDKDREASHDNVG